MRCAILKTMYFRLFFEKKCRKHTLTLHNPMIFCIFAAVITNNRNKMKTLIEKIAASYEAFVKDATAQTDTGNKAAGARARKASLEIEKMMKEFRKASLEASKQ